MPQELQENISMLLVLISYQRKMQTRIFLDLCRRGTFHWNRHRSSYRVLTAYHGGQVHAVSLKLSLRAAWYSFCPRRKLINGYRYFTLSHGGSSPGISAVLLSSRRHPAADFVQCLGVPCPAGLVMYLPFFLRIISLPSQLLNSSVPCGSTAQSQALCMVAKAAACV